MIAEDGHSTKSKEVIAKDGVVVALKQNLLVDEISCNGLKFDVVECSYPD